MKSIAYTLIFIFLIQGCVVYHKTPITLEDAYEKGMVKVIATDGSKLKYDNLIQKDGVPYGAIDYMNDTTNFWREYIKDENGDKVLDYLILPSEIKSVHLKNKVVSAALYALPIIVLGVIIIVMANFEMNIDF